MSYERMYVRVSVSERLRERKSYTLLTVLNDSVGSFESFMKRFILFITQHSRCDDESTQTLSVSEWERRREFVQMYGYIYYVNIRVNIWSVRMYVWMCESVHLFGILSKLVFQCSNVLLGSGGGEALDHHIICSLRVQNVFVCVSEWMKMCVNVRGRVWVHMYVYINWITSMWACVLSGFFTMTELLLRDEENSKTSKISNVTNLPRILSISESKK